MKTGRIALSWTLWLALGLAARADEPAEPPYVVLSRVEAAPAHLEEEEGHAHPRITFGAEYLVWWFKDNQLPPLVTTGPANVFRPGSLASPGTAVLFGDRDIDTGEHRGGRFLAAYWLDEAIGYEVRGMFLAEESIDFAANSAAYPVLARPFFNSVGPPLGFEDVVLIAFPDLAAGTRLDGQIQVSLSSQLWGLEGNRRAGLCEGEDWRIDWLIGFRFLDLDEDLVIRDSARETPVGDRFDRQESFRTSNQFYGGQLGLIGEMHRGRWGLEGRVQVALGGTYEECAIQGVTVQTSPAGMVQTLPFGFLAQSTNIGTYTQNDFTAIPEFNLSARCQITSCLSASLSYTFLYWSNLLRPGNEIDRVINPTQIPPSVLVGQPRPEFQYKNADFWAQGIGLGLEFRY